MKQNLTPRINRLEPNIVIDGGMEIWPEGTSRSVTNGTTAYGAVLFKTSNISTGITLTNSQQASVPSSTSIPFSNQISKTAAGTLAAGTQSLLSYYIEGYDGQRLLSDSSTLLFWVKSSVAATRSVSLISSTASHSYVQQYAIAAANTWQLVALNLPALTTCPGTINKTNGFAIQVVFNVVSGSTLQTSTLGSWVAGTFASGISEDTTWLTGTNHDFSIAGVMVLPGDWSALTSAGYNFLRAGRNFQDELAMTQRYYEKSYLTDVAPGSNSNPGAMYEYQTSGNYMTTQFEFAVNKRAVPTVILYNTVTGAQGQMRGITGFGSYAIALAAISERVVSTSQNVGITEIFAYHWTADARF